MKINVEDLIYDEDGIAILKTVDDVYTHNVFATAQMLKTIENILDFSEQTLEQTKEIEALTTYIVSMYNYTVDVINTMNDNELTSMELTRDILQNNNLRFGYNPVDKTLIVQKKEKIKEAI